MNTEEKKKQDINSVIDVAVFIAPIILLQNATFAIFESYGLATKVAISIVPIALVVLLLRSMKSRRNKIVLNVVLFAALIIAAIVYRLLF